MKPHGRRTTSPTSAARRGKSRTGRMTTDPKVKQRGPRRRMRYVATPAEWELIRELKLTGCRLCGRGPYLCSLHHIVPRSLGGDDVADNLVCLCGDGTRGCHGLAEAREGETLAALADALTPPERAYARSKLGPFALERLYGLPSRNHQRPLERGRNPRKPERPGGVVDTGHTPGSPPSLVAKSAETADARGGRS